MLIKNKYDYNALPGYMNEPRWYTMCFKTKFKKKKKKNSRKAICLVWTMYFGRVKLQKSLKGK